MAFTLTTDLHPSDAKELGRVKTAAFQQSDTIRVRFEYEKYYDSIEQWATSLEKVDLRNPEHKRTVAIINTADNSLQDDDQKPTEPAPGARKVVAYARWILPGGSTNQGVNVQGLESELHKLKNDADSLPLGTNIGFMKDFRKGLAAAKEKYLNKDKDWHPEFFRQGHGSTLLKWGLERADAAKARVYVEATPEGLSLYKRHGWKEIDELSWNLADYGIDDKGACGGKTWIVLMMREPVCA